MKAGVQPRPSFLFEIELEEPSYNWFNFIVDVGSSLGTWVGISVVTLIDFAVNPRATMKELFNF